MEDIGRLDKRSARGGTAEKRRKEQCDTSESDFGRHITHYIIIATRWTLGMVETLEAQVLTTMEVRVQKPEVFWPEVEVGSRQCRHQN
jgi:hypothetical protein